jgi:D-alanyl-D-alanine carboxypeptidase
MNEQTLKRRTIMGIVKHGIQHPFAVLSNRVGKPCVAKDFTFPTIQTLNQLEQKIQEYVGNYRIPALVCGVLDNNETIYTRAFGTIRPESDYPCYENSIFKWWSFTKVFTSLAILQLDAQHALSIDDPVCKYLPKFQPLFRGKPIHTITIRQLQDHSTGLPNNIPQVLAWARKSNEPIDSQRALFISKFPYFRNLRFEPGTAQYYTNVGYMALGALIETVTEQPYEEYILNHILKPMDMTETAFEPPAGIDPRRIVMGSHRQGSIEATLLSSYYKRFYQDYVYTVKRGRIWFHPFYPRSTPPSGLIGPIQDVFRFCRLFFPGNQNQETETVLPARIREQMLDDRVLKSPIELVDEKGSAKFGLGWKLDRENGELVYSHAGKAPGFGALLRIYPERRRALVVLTNEMHSPTIPILQSLHRMI